MADLETSQLVLIGLIFVWSGFVRTSLGFGGAVLSLPFLLLVRDEPLVFLPIIAIHLLIFASWIAWRGHRQLVADSGGQAPSESNIDWGYLLRAMKVMIIPKLIGVVGLLTLPGNVLTRIIFVIVMVYAVGYVLNRPFRSHNRVLDGVLLVLGGYVSGTSLIGAPLIVAVFATHVAAHQLRDTLFVLWFILVLIKMVFFVIAGVDLQLIHQLWLLPCALVGHLLGERAHRHLLASRTNLYFRVLGGVLILVSVVGLVGSAG
ncbi:sulfite exporter TauE/SafE family protein [Halomonas sp. 11-S5]|uniref:sulfite exporter TauE/SafE family protein n=1 Tax=Halomonas sp. 11-S5 TaxID=2994064 RepID=UPI002468F23B|nr:sulfite exporter TauE/SafE family protein [Halomonas sp. 11-S5]